MNKRRYTGLIALLLFLVLALPAAGSSADYPPFAVIGDTRIGLTETVYKQFLEKTGRQGIDLIFITGDVIDKPGAANEWKRFLELTGTKRSFHIAPGNHDFLNESSFQVYEKEVARPPYYSFAINKVQFIILCSTMPTEQNRVTGKQFEWLKGELAKPFSHRIVFIHSPVFPSTFGKNYGLDKYPGERDRLHHLFRDNNVKIVFAGHEHLYNRSERDGITYVITGGGGARLLTFNEEHGGFFHYIIAKRGKEGYIFSVYDLHDSKRDEFYLNE